MWDLPRPGLEPVSPALAGRFSTTASPGKPPSRVFLWELDCTTQDPFLAHQELPLSEEQVRVARSGVSWTLLVFNSELRMGMEMEPREKGVGSMVLRHHCPALFFLILPHPSWPHLPPVH